MNLNQLDPGRNRTRMLRGKKLLSPSPERKGVQPNSLSKGFEGRTNSEREGKKIDCSKKRRHAEAGSKRRTLSGPGGKAQEASRCEKLPARKRRGEDLSSH